METARRACQRFLKKDLPNLSIVRAAQTNFENEITGREAVQMGFLPVPFEFSRALALVRLFSPIMSMLREKTTI